MATHGTVIQTVKYEEDSTGGVNTVDSTAKVYSPSTGLHAVRFPDQANNSSLAYHEMTSPQLWNQLEKTWCDIKRYPPGVYVEYLQKTSKIITIFTGPYNLATYIDTQQYHMMFSDSIGSLINIETLKNRSVIPVSTQSTTTSYMSGDEVSPLPGEVNYNTIYRVEPDSKTKNISYKTINLTKELHDECDDLFKHNMSLIKDPKIITNVTEDGSTWKSVPSIRSDGIGSPDNVVMKGVAHGRNLVTDSKHYDRMYNCYTELIDIIQDRLSDMYRAWEYKRSHGNNQYIDKIYTEHTVENQIITVDIMTQDKVSDTYRRSRTNMNVFS